MHPAQHCIASLSFSHFAQTYRTIAAGTRKTKMGAPGDVVHRTPKAAATWLLEQLADPGIVLLEGCMYAGKTESVCRLMEEVPEMVCVAYHTGDGVLDSTSHNPHYALPPHTLYTRTLASPGFRAVAAAAHAVFIDEIQWFLADGDGALAVLQEYSHNTTFVLTGLSSDFRGAPFAGMRRLEAVARTATIVGRCADCGADSTHTRIVTPDAAGDGVYAPNAAYEPVCAAHHHTVHSAP